MALEADRPDGRMVCGEAGVGGFTSWCCRHQGRLGTSRTSPQRRLGSVHWHCSTDAVPTVAADVAIPGLACADVCRAHSCPRCNPRDTYILRSDTRRGPKRTHTAHQCLPACTDTTKLAPATCWARMRQSEARLCPRTNTQLLAPAAQAGPWGCDRMRHVLGPRLWTGQTEGLVPPR